MKIGDLAIISVQDLQIFQLKLFDRILDPHIAKAFPSRNRGRACAQHGPHRAFKSASV